MFSPRSLRRLTAFGIALLVISSAADGVPAKIAVLRIGSTSTMTGVADAPKEKAGAEILRKYIKEETGLTNEIVAQQKWEELATKMAKGQCQLGVFQGYEFAWAQEKYPDLKPLAVGINVENFPVACVVVGLNNPAKDFAGLKGQAIVMPVTGQGFLQLFIDRQCEKSGQKIGAFFSKVSSSEQIEDTLDDVVDGKAQVTVTDHATLEAYKQQKPGRFKQLRIVVQSQPFPPVVVAYYGSILDQSTLQKFKECLLRTSKNEKGEMLLTLSRLSAFENVPAEFDRVLAETRKAYPHP